jgi:hypothetical protein
LFANADLYIVGLVFPFGSADLYIVGLVLAFGSADLYIVGLVLAFGSADLYIVGLVLPSDARTRILSDSCFRSDARTRIIFPSDSEVGLLYFWTPIFSPLLPNVGLVSVLGVPRGPLKSSCMFSAVRADPYIPNVCFRPSARTPIFLMYVFGVTRGPVYS